MWILEAMNVDETALGQGCREIGILGKKDGVLAHSFELQNFMARLKRRNT